MFRLPQLLWEEFYKLVSWLISQCGRVPRNCGRVNVAEVREYCNAARCVNRTQCPSTHEPVLRLVDHAEAEGQQNRNEQLHYFLPLLDVFLQHQARAETLTACTWCVGACKFSPSTERHSLYAIYANA